MSNYNKYTLFYGYCVDEKWDLINDIENSKEEFWDGIPEFSLNHSNNQIGYKIVKDNLGREELYFGVKLYVWDEYQDISSKAFKIDNLQIKYEKQINEKYEQLFNEKPENKRLSICIVCECI
jgi:hypothetical protein